MEINSKEQYEKFIGYIDEYLPERAESLKNMYNAFGKRLLLAPASAIEHYHNAFPGGYLDHVLRVVDLAIKLYDFYETNGMDLSGFTKSNLVFVAINHDLGKLGYVGEGREKYIPNDSEWHRKNMGKIYTYNEKIPFAITSDLSLYTLQKFGVEVQWEEYLGIKIHDGLYEEGNKPYYISRMDSSSLRTNLQYIMHMADLMASKHEYRTWKNIKEGKVEQNPNKIVNTKDNKKEESDKTLEEFRQMFKSS
jgi:hypothetical protein